MYVCWPTIVKVNSEASFSITQGVGGRRYSFPWIASLTLDSYLRILSVKQRGIKNPYILPPAMDK